MQLVCVQFEGMGDLEENTHGRATRPRAIKKPCPSCAVDCAPFLKNAQVCPLPPAWLASLGRTLLRADSSPEVQAASKHLMQAGVWS